MSIAAIYQAHIRATPSAVNKNDLHLLAKLLDNTTAEQMIEMGFSGYEIAAADELFDVLDLEMTKFVGIDWDVREVL